MKMCFHALLVISPCVCEREYTGFSRHHPRNGFARVSFLLVENV